MRVSFVLLAATALLASSDIVSAATDKEQTKLSQVTSYDAVGPLDAAHVNAPAKRFLRINRDEQEEDLDEDPENEDRTVNLGMVDDVLSKSANKMAVAKVLRKVKRAQSKGASVEGLLPVNVLKYAQKDPKQTLFKRMYRGGVSVENFGNMMKYNPNLAHNFEDVYTGYKRFKLFYDSRAATNNIV